jgi:hypothetical protein
MKIFAIKIKVTATEGHEHKQAKIIKNGDRIEQILNLNIWDAAYQCME